VPAWATVVHRRRHPLGAMVVGITLMALRRRRLPGHNTGLSLAVLGLTVFLSVLGYKTPSPLLPWVTLSNLLGGMAMLAMLWWLGQRSVSPVVDDARATTLQPWARVGVFLVFLQIALAVGSAPISPRWPAPVFPAAVISLARRSLARESQLVPRVPITDGGVIITGDVAKSST
jgi:heme A synthase